MIVAVDTSVIVAALGSWHGQHEAALRAVNQLLAKRSLILPQHALIEAYSVLTRLPSPIRIAPSAAFRLLHETFGSVPIAALSSRDIWRTLEELASRSVVGGRIYDAAIARAAREAKADAILTLNVGDFEKLGEGLRVIIP